MKNNLVSFLLGLWMLVAAWTYPYAVESGKLPVRTRGDWVAQHVVIAPIMSVGWPIFWALELGWGEGSEM